tara:strand:- start:2094 stop:2831 length:738 start_codon:yes stop_codon:yes gene_type:complete
MLKYNSIISTNYVIVQKLNFKQIRKDRQKNNENKAILLIKKYGIELLIKKYDSLNSKFKKKNFLNNNGINNKQFCRVFNLFGIEYLKRLEKSEFILLFIKLILVQSSRQSSLDEKILLNTLINIYPNIKKSKNIRSNKNGYILSGKKITGDLKSYDFKISGKINGFIASKIVYANGGHQDNVKEELINYIYWWKEHGYKYPDKYFIIVLITDLDKMKNELVKICEEYNKIKVFNEIELQYFLKSI